MSKTIAVHVRYKSLYISLPSSAKQQREMTKFFVDYGTWTTTANFSIVFPFGIKPCQCIFSLSTFLEQLVYRTDLDNCELCWQNINSYFTWRRPPALHFDQVANPERFCRLQILHKSGRVQNKNRPVWSCLQRF